MAQAVAKFLTPAEAGRILELTPDGVRLAADSGRLPVAATTQSGRRLFSPEDVERFRRERAKAAKK